MAPITRGLNLSARTAYDFYGNDLVNFRRIFIIIAIIGDAGVDRYYRISRFRRGTTHIASYSVLHPAGGSANAAAHAAAAGAEVTLFAAVGHDEAGQLFRAACAVIPRLKIRLRELNEDLRAL